MNKESLIKYAREIGLKINEDDSFENIYEKVIMIILKNQEQTKKERHRIKYEKIPQRKLVLKNDNMKIIQGIFPKRDE